jgi:hypothetical protein
MYEKIPDCEKKHSNRRVLQKKRKKNGGYFEKLSIPLTETGRNRDRRSETRRKTKQMRKEKRSIWFEPLYKCKNLTSNLQGKKRIQNSQTAKTVRELRKTKFREKERKKHSRRYTRKIWTVQKATNLTRRNKDYRSKEENETRTTTTTNERTKTIDRIWTLFTRTKLDAKYVCKGKRKFHYTYK